MKYPCGLVKDIMPLYHDNVCGDESRRIVDEHFGECSECREYYKSFCDADKLENIAYDEQKETQKAESIKNVKKSMKKRTVLLILLGCVATAIMAVVINIVLLCAGVFMLVTSSVTAEVEENTDISRYENFIGENADEKYRDKWGMNEEILPKEISGGMSVADYKSVYYNPWDAQYLTLLVIDYDDAHFADELKRLENFDSTDYIGYYGVTGFSGKYRLAAMYADSYQGFVYALTDDNGRIIYVEMIFCNYFMDLDYNEYIPKEYLPDGFDATMDNPYENKMMSDTD